MECRILSLSNLFLTYYKPRPVWYRSAQRHACELWANRQTPIGVPLSDIGLQVNSKWTDLDEKWKKKKKKIHRNITNWRNAKHTGIRNFRRWSDFDKRSYSPSDVDEETVVLARSSKNRRYKKPVEAFEQVARKWSSGKGENASTV